MSSSASESNNSNNMVPTVSSVAERKPSSGTINKRESSTENSDEIDTCVVCFKTLEIYSIGECDHPVCYECSTRMRVLCQQNECPICRAMLNKVIFTYDKMPYRELESKNRSEYYSKKYKISFYNSEIQQRFFALLDHPCPKCNCLPYRTFQGLRNHVKREHDMLYCDLCVEHLKIFTFERRCYTQPELNIHRNKGDADNKSHRGHPLCEYCNKRYLDRDELFRHLRREHYFCHFCDADGRNEFYKDYDALADHFRQSHYLCEEGRCATEQFVGAFRTEIDYKAHVASMHSNTLNKQQAKQTRTLQLEITLGPRPGRNTQHEQGIANLRSRRAVSESSEEDEDNQNMVIRQTQSQNQTIDAHNEDQFPSLLSSNNGPNMSLVAPPPPPLALRRNAASGLARTKENFPELGGGGGGGGGAAMNMQKGRSGIQPIAAMLKRVPNPTVNNAMVSANNGGSPGMMIHVSNRPQQHQQGSNQNNQMNKKAGGVDFPALPMTNSAKAKKQQQQQQQQRTIQSGSAFRKMPLPQSTQDERPIVPNPYNGSVSHSQRSLEEDMVPSPSNMGGFSGIVAAKHRTLVDDYVSVANPKNFHKLQTVQQAESDLKKKAAAGETQPAAVPNLRSAEFPSLGGGGSGGRTLSNNNVNSNWGKPLLAKKQRELENRKSKVAVPPLLSMTTATTTTTMNGNNKNNPNSMMGKKQQSVAPLNEATGKKDKKNSKDKTKENNSQQLNKQNGKNVNSNTSQNNYKNNSSQNQLQPQEPLRQQNQMSLHPPPGFNNVDDDNTTTTTSSDSNVNSKNNKNINKPNKESNSLPWPHHQTQTPPPPPGFQATNVTVNSIAKSPNNLTFTTSLGESFNIVPKHVYTPLPESRVRNQNLVGLFKNAMNNNHEAFEEFRTMSQLYREDSLKASAFYEHCQSALGNKFDSIFPELLTLLPDISKQQALYLVHTQRMKSLSADERKHFSKLEVCGTCKQILLVSDAVSHKNLHEFPDLRSGGVNNNFGKRK